MSWPLTIEPQFRRGHEHTGAGIIVRHPRSRYWVRVHASYGFAPGSHWGLWRTRLDDLRGWNFRFGRSLNQCVTLLAHRGRRSF